MNARPVFLVENSSKGAKCLKLHFPDSSVKQVKMSLNLIHGDYIHAVFLAVLQKWVALALYQDVVIVVALLLSQDDRNQSFFKWWDTLRRKVNSFLENRKRLTNQIYFFNHFFSKL